MTQNRRHPTERAIPALLLLALTLPGCGSEAAPAEEPPAAVSPAATAGASTTQPQPPATADPAAPAGQENATELDPDELPEVVARVNDHDIDREELLASAREIAAELSGAAGSAPDTGSAEFYDQVLESIISSELLYQDALERGLRAEPEEVQNQVTALESRAPSADAFAAALESRGLTREELAQSIERSLTIDRYISEEIVPDVAVAPEEEQAFYEAHQDRMKRPEQVRVRHILVAVPEDADAAARDSARQEAEQLREQVAAGADFAELAASSSDDPQSGSRGGELGWVARGQTVAPFEEAAFALQAGELSPVVETRFGFHVLQVQERRPAATLSFQEVQPQVRQFLRQQKIQEAVAGRLESLRQQAEIERFL